jgi:hypothetical protein
MELDACAVFIFFKMSSHSESENSEVIEALNQPLPGVMTRSIAISDFNEVIDNCGALAFPSPSFSEDELTAEREKKEKEVKRKRQIFAFVIVCLLIVGGIIIEKIKF